jgi:hypothetical protein
LLQPEDGQLVKVSAEHPEDDVIDNDIILVWGAQKRISAPDPVAACEAAEAGAGTSNYSSIEGKTFQTKHHQK